MYNKILMNDEQGNDRFTIEVAVLSGPTMGDWRTRNEKTTIWQYMQELAKSGMHLGDLMSRYKTRLEYEKLIASIYIRMANDWGGVSTDGSVHVPPTFWDHLIIQASLEIAQNGNFHGHTRAELQRIVDELKEGGQGMTENDSVGFAQVLLIGNLGDGENNGSAGLKERVGVGEVREEALGLVDGLAFRDVLLR
ncbi:Uncharacterized protein HZ326_21931 [Fusarium oxysporum f. sp. albedinis]|nr:Uncharacterized protein HZ326_21931 [Fusarium oxysporum f. sp. albedinis]